MPGQRSRYESTSVALSIKKMLEDLPPRPQNPSIQRVSHLLRSRNEQAYEPRIVSIGPFHRGKQHLNVMEQEKKWCLKQLLLSCRDNSEVDTYVKKIGALQDGARRCYSEPITLEGDEFVKMLLLDSVFIVQFLRKFLALFDTTNTPSGVSADPPSEDAIFKFGHVITHVLHDLVLLENQIPFFVIEEIYGLTAAQYGPKKIGLLMKPLVFPNAYPACGSVQTNGADHLLAMVHRINCHSFRVIQDGGYMSNINSATERSDNYSEFENINSATELTEAGILFQRVTCDETSSTSWLDIKFKGNKIYISTLEVTDGTESLFRNMIAYEYYLPCNEPKYVTDYMFFMHCLIHAPKDAQLLRRHGVISNWLGGDDMVYHLINQLGANTLTSNAFSYTELFNDVHRHCQRRRNRWYAILRRDYFNSPWKFISFVAGVVLLGAGIVQMVFAILSYCNDRKYVR